MHYPDLTPYCYPEPLGALEGIDLPPGYDRNVGWLERGYAFPTAVPSDGFVAALWRCAQRLDNLYRGFHSCNLSHRSAHTIADPVIERDALNQIGNGEVAVVGADGHGYRAPAMILHYVAVHHYAPPQVFVDAVIGRAPGIVLLSTEARAALKALRPEAQLALSMRAVEVYAASRPDDAWLAKSLVLLRDAMGALGERARLDPLLQRFYAWESDDTAPGFYSAPRQLTMTLAMAFGYTCDAHGRLPEVASRAVETVVERTFEAVQTLPPDLAAYR